MNAARGRTGPQPHAQGRSTRHESDTVYRLRGRWMQLSTHCAFFTRAIGFGDIRSLLRGPRRAVRGARKQAQARGVKGGRWGGLLCRGMAWTWASQQRAREKTIEVQKLESMRCLGGNFGALRGNMIGRSTGGQVMSSLPFQRLAIVFGSCLKAVEVLMSLSLHPPSPSTAAPAHGNAGRQWGDGRRHRAPHAPASFTAEQHGGAGSPF